MSCLIDHVRGERLPDNVEDDVGRQILLPASHTGYPRDLHRRSLNAIAMVAVAGKPDLFITFTCNPRWPEIQSALGPHDTANDRPDILARVFAFKFKQFLQDVYVHSAFGAVAGYSYAIEFQKRGLPHAHLLVILVDKVTSPEQVDRITSAELPDPVSQLHLYTAVCKHMMHGPCGDQNPKCPCMRNGTTLAHPSIAPPSTPANVEISTGLKTVKYIFKYVHKGPDRAYLEAHASTGKEGAVNEIKQYLDTRYVAAYEAAYRVFRLPMYGQSSTVEVLPVTCQGSNSSTSERARQKRHYRN